MQTVRTRIAPSPSGNLHVGTAHTALFNFFFARHFKGKFILRIDDSDQSRSQKKYEINIIESLRWLGIQWDEGPDIGGPYSPYRQSERKNTYHTYLEKLLYDGNAYYCYCTPDELNSERKLQEQQKIATKYSGKCSLLTKADTQELIDQGRKPAVRFKNPCARITFTDLIRGTITVDTSLFGDFIIARSHGTTLLNLAATIDDIEMKITHAIRGEDFLNLVPRQILLFNALGYIPPQFAHLSFLYAPDKTKLSKRHGATSVTEYKDMGILPEAMINYLATLGWAIPPAIIERNKLKGVAEEIVSFQEIIENFQIEDVKSSAPIFDIEKLKWMNGVYIRSLSDEQLFKRVENLIPQDVDKKRTLRIAALAKNRMKTLNDFTMYLKPFLHYVTVKLENNQHELVSKFLPQFNTIKNWNAVELESICKQIVNDGQLSIRDTFMALRLAVTGEKIGLPLFETLDIMGKKEVLSRMEKVE